MKGDFWDYLSQVIPYMWLGNCSARQAIVYSMNVVSANFLVNTVGYSEISSVLENYAPKEILISSDFDDLAKLTALDIIS